METVVEKRLITAHEFEAMAQAGVFPEGERLELLHGEIVKMAPQTHQHVTATNRLEYLFANRLYGIEPLSAVVSVQSGAELSDYERPEPDVALVTPEAGHQRGVKRGDIYLAVEVAVYSLRYDRDVKLPIYAAAGIPEVWIVDLEGEAIHVYSKPVGETYSNHTIKRRGDELDVGALPDIDPLAADAILGSGFVEDPVASSGDGPDEP